ncbi:hypothetical protein [Polaromonas hydrogenivorans]|uniref:Uncharacterized protein n=1 Tax=Polaromonas hydrogenivorans TaxID=335476 RepID=A0AAU7LQK4_9BURK
MYAPNFGAKFSADAPPIEIKRQGLRDVSVFNGFCAKHDAALFSCLENEPFKFDRRQLFRLAYRAAARECYLKRKQCESLPTLEQMKAIHGITEEISYTDEILIHQAASLRGAEECEQLKAKLDKLLVSSSWDRMVTYAILFEKAPCLTACFVFQPFHDLDGRQLQDYENLDAEMSQLAITVMPVDQGAVAIFSWLDTANSAPRRFFESVASSSNRTSAVIHAVLDNSENFALSPDWYEALPDTTKNYLLSRMCLLEASIEYHYRQRPEVTASFLADWGVSQVAQF